MADVQVKLRRAIIIDRKYRIEPEDIEEYGIDEYGRLTCRYCRSDSELPPIWDTEEETLEAYLGFVPKSQAVIEIIRKELANLDTLEPYDKDNSVINYGRY